MAHAFFFFRFLILVFHSNDNITHPSSGNFHSSATQKNSPYPSPVIVLIYSFEIFLFMLLKCFFSKEKGWSLDVALGKGESQYHQLTEIHCLFSFTFLGCVCVVLCPPARTSYVALSRIFFIFVASMKQKITEIKFQNLKQTTGLLWAGSSSSC